MLDIDQGDNFDEIIQLRTTIVERWGLDLKIVRNSDILDKVNQINNIVKIADLNLCNRQALAEIGFTDIQFPGIPSSPVCNRLVKAVPVADYLKGSSFTSHVY